jgi:hypothetical protein
MNFKKRIKQTISLTLTVIVAVMSFGNPAQAQSYGQVQAERENRYYSNPSYERAYQEKRQAEIGNSYSNGFGSSNQARVQAERENRYYNNPYASQRYQEQQQAERNNTYYDNNPSQ